MILIGLAGQARCGKDTVADYLVRSYGFVKFAFSDALYFEVSQAFGVSIEFLRGESKDVESSLLALKNCMDSEFVRIAGPLVSAENPDTFGTLEEFPISPRRILQWWGTQYRRAQDPQYWIKKAAQFIDAVHEMAAYPEQQQQYFVEVGTRFENEREFVKSVAGGNIWHIHRDSIDAPGQGHISAVPLAVLEGERELWNNDTKDRLCRGIDILISTSNRFVRVEPMVAHTGHAIEDTDIGCPACQQEIAEGDRLTPEEDHFDASLTTPVIATRVDIDRGAEVALGGELYTELSAPGIANETQITN